MGSGSVCLAFCLLPSPLSVSPDPSPTMRPAGRAAGVEPHLLSDIRDSPSGQFGEPLRFHFPALGQAPAVTRRRFARSIAGPCMTEDVAALELVRSAVSWNTRSSGKCARS